ncbi:MAG: SDR family oxidoreductase [Parachlamydiaceae bacterium]
MNWTLITGSSLNLGAKTAISLAEQGHHVLIHYNKSVEQAEAVANRCRKFGVRAELIQGDFSMQEGVEAFICHLLCNFPDVKTLINNVGNYLHKSALETSQKEWQEIFQLNLFTPIALTRALIPSIKQSKGSIINIGTAGISLKAHSVNTAYMAAKTSLLLFTKTLAKELAPSQVTVNMVSPGQLETSVVEVKNIPMGREAEFKDVTSVILFLLQQSSHYLTGQNIEVAGGLCL